MEKCKAGKEWLRNGHGITFSVPAGSLKFWKRRFETLHVHHQDIDERFGEKRFSFQDPDGLWINLTESKTTDGRNGWKTADVKADIAIKGFHTVTLTLNTIQPTATVLTEISDYEFLEQDGNIYRYHTDAVEGANLVDLLEESDAQTGLNAGGTNHHVAFRVKDEVVLMAFGEKIIVRGIHITEKIDRGYFFSLYFREPGGVLFEIATDNQGFATDESLEALGSSLRLPDHYEPMRAQIEKRLPL